MPADAKSLALICDDPDAPAGTWVHWVLYDLPATTAELNEKVPTLETLPNGAKQGVNDFKRVGYGGPRPPPGKLHVSDARQLWPRVMQLWPEVAEKGLQWQQPAQPAESPFCGVLA